MVKVGGRKKLASGSSCSLENIKEELEVLKKRCYQLEIQERREAEKKYENLLKEVGQVEETLVSHTQRGAEH